MSCGSCYCLLRENPTLPVYFWSGSGLAGTIPTLDVDNELQPRFSLYFTSMKKTAGISYF